MCPVARVNSFGTTCYGFGNIFQTITLIYWMTDSADQRA
uniref:Uncharacterized protein n=1 Tax=Anguilla anguilla TaxID=7936 RepID=A0A0E9QW37_ANGAN